MSRARQRGQAAVESAMMLPLVVFMVLGFLQLFLLLQAKVMAQYAVFQAARVGSVTGGRCDAMVHAAVLSVIPAIRPFVNPNIPGTPGQQLAAVFTQFSNNDYGSFRTWSNTEAVVWIVRESPRFPRDPLLPARERFDDPLGAGQVPVRLELRMIFWSPLLIPFADWVFTRMALAHLGLMAYTAQNPLMMTQRASNWSANQEYNLQGPIATELLARVRAQHYVYPIDVSYTMRMMSPVQRSQFVQPNCPPTPNSL